MKKYLFVVLALFLAAFNQAAMASILSMTVTPSPSTVIINQPTTASIAVLNGSTALTLSNLIVTATVTGVSPVGGRLPAAYSVYVPNSVALAASTTTTFPAQIIFFSPSTGVTGAGTGTYSIGATLYTSDGAVTTSATAGTVTVNPVPLPAYERL